MATVIEVDCSTGIVTERDETPDEMAVSQKMADEIATKQATEEQTQATQAASLASAQAKLTALGLTAEEVAAITGLPTPTV